MEENSKDEFVFDTSALISLGIAKLIDKVLEISKIITSQGVIDELDDFAKFSDKYGNTAREVLKFKESFSISEINIKEEINYISKTDNELYNLAKEKSIPIITDDIKLCRHIDNIATTYFSTFFLVALITSDKLSKEKALELLDKMKENRNWRGNIIYIASKNEIESL